MRLMYSWVSCSEVSLPEAISACSWATVASLCSVGTEVCERPCPNAEAGASRAANSKIRIAGVFIFFPPGSLGRGLVARNQNAAGGLFEGDKIVPLAARSQSGLLLMRYTH